MRDAWNDGGEAMARLRRAFRSRDKERIRRAWHNARRVTRDEGLTRRQFDREVEVLRGTAGFKPDELALDETPTKKEEGNRADTW